MSRRGARTREPAASAARITEGDDASERAVSGGGQPATEPEPAHGELPAETPAAGVEPAFDTPQERLAWLRQRIIGESSDVMARIELARLHVQRGEHQLAVEQYEAARAEHPDSVEAALGLAETLVAMNRFDAAERELRRLLRLQPDNGRAHQQLGIANFRRGLYLQAEQDLQRALELLPESAALFYYRGEALNQLNRVDEAIAMMERALQLDTSNARAYYVMGILYDKKRQPQEAAVMYRRAREVTAS